MLKRYVGVLALGLALFASAPLLAARSDPLPPHARHIPELDGRPVLAVTADGHGWLAWSYRNGSQFDIAVAEFAEGAWSEPLLLETRDGLDQVEPAIAADPSGNLYVAYTVEPLGVVRLVLFSAATRSWSAPVQISASEHSAGLPTLKVVGGQLVSAFREGDQVRIVVFALDEIFDRDVREIIDGPDPIGGLKK